MQMIVCAYALTFSLSLNKGSKVINLHFSHCCFVRFAFHQSEYVTVIHTVLNVFFFLNVNEHKYLQLQLCK